MAVHESPNCPECVEAFDFPQPSPIDRRNFLVAVTAATVTAGTLATNALAKDTPAPTTEKKPRPAEELIRELFSTLKDEQKKRVVLAYDHGAPAGKKKGTPTRQKMVNEAMLGVKINSVYTKAQIELLERIVKAMCSGDEGYRRISRGGNWDASKSFENCGALIFGDPTPGEKYAFVFSGHHLTIRCDGNSEPGAAFGGPMYYGHSPQGYSRGNFFFYQTKAVLDVYKALSEKQREQAVVKRGDPGEGEESIRFKGKDWPGIAFADLSKDQKDLVEKVMREILSPYRKEDGDEVMDVVKANGGMDKIRLAYYPDDGMKDNEPWHFWRLEGPGFVWNYRVLPHVHTYVNISSKLTGGA
jgi:hypothetical protein